MDRRERTSLMRRLLGDAERIASHFNLEYRGIVPERQGVKSRYGACYADGLIKIRLNHAKTGNPLKYSSLIDTLCHELAHLKHFNHGPEFKAFFIRMLGWARREGIYRPGPTGRPRPGEASRPEFLARRAPLQRRNGQPVFPEFEPAAADDAAPPWERYFSEAIRGRTPPEPPPPNRPRAIPTPPPAPPVAPAPASVSAPASRPSPVASRRRPEQLELF
jgi:hypothetical protein